MRYVLFGLATAFLFVAWIPQGSDRGPTQDTWDAPEALAHVPEPALDVAPSLHGTGPVADAPRVEKDAAAVIDDTTEFVVEEDLPPDPLGTGTASLRLVFLDAKTDAPIETGYVLWRLDVPGNVNWTRGDQAQATGEAPASGVEVRRLPEGRYRVHSHAARHGADDAPAFVVSGDATTQQVRVALPRRRRAYVSVFDERGNTLHRAGWTRGSWTCSTRSSRPPDWVSDRRLTENRMCFFGLGGGVIACGCRSARSAIPIEATAQGFDMGIFEEASRYTSRRHRHTLRFQARSDVNAKIETDQLSAEPLVGLAVSMAWLRERIRLPDGRLLADTDYELEATSDAVHPEPGAGAFEVAAATPIEVTVKNGNRELGTAVLHLDSSDVLLKPRKP